MKSSAKQNIQSKEHYFAVTSRSFQPVIVRSAIAIIDDAGVFRQFPNDEKFDICGL
jgi:hypothetical protein